MAFENSFVRHHPNLFRFEKADQVFLHDRFLEWSILPFLPNWVTPNFLTTLRIIGTPFVLLFLLREHYASAVMFFLILASTDALDGSLARTQSKITAFGKLYDPLADKLLIGTMVVTLLFTHFPPALGFTILGLEILFIIGAFFAKVKFKKVKSANCWGKIKMIAQVVAVCFTLFALVWSVPALFGFAYWIFGIAIASAVLSLFTQGI